MTGASVGLVSAQSYQLIISTSERQDTFLLLTLAFTAPKVLIGYYSTSLHLQPQPTWGLISMATKSLPAVEISCGNTSRLMNRWKRSAKDGNWHMMEEEAIKHQNWRNVFALSLLAKSRLYRSSQEAKGENEGLTCNNIPWLGASQRFYCCWCEPLISMMKAVVRKEMRGTAFKWNTSCLALRTLASMCHSETNYAQTYWTKPMSNTDNGLSVGFAHLDEPQQVGEIKEPIPRQTSAPCWLLILNLNSLPRSFL